ncbi:MAG: hypothetical protein V8Q75_04925 [Bacilli bacterium]
MGMKDFWKRKKKKPEEISIFQDDEIVDNSLIDIEINGSDWGSFLFDARLLGMFDDYHFLKKLGFKDGDSIQIISQEVSEEIKEKIEQWQKGNGEKIPKHFYKIISKQKGEFIFGVCNSSVTLMTADLTEEKKYDFCFSELDSSRLVSEKNIICQQDMKLEIVYNYDRLIIMCQGIHENNRLLKFEFTLEDGLFGCFDTIEEAEDKINCVKGKSYNIIKQLLELKEIPNNENNKGIIKLLEGKLYLGDFFDSEILLKEIVLTSGNREDKVIFNGKKVENYQIKYLEQDIVMATSSEYGLIRNSDYEIKTSANGTVIKLPKITKDTWLNGINQPLSDFVLDGINTQESMDELLMNVERVMVKSLKPENKYNI